MGSVVCVCVFYGIKLINFLAVKTLIYYLVVVVSGSGCEKLCVMMAILWKMLNDLMPKLGNLLLLGLTNFGDIKGFPFRRFSGHASHERLLR